MCVCVGGFEEWRVCVCGFEEWCVCVCVDLKNGVCVCVDLKNGVCVCVCVCVRMRASVLAYPQDLNPKNCLLLMERSRYQS